MIGDHNQARLMDRVEPDDDCPLFKILPDASDNPGVELALWPTPAWLSRLLERLERWGVM